MLRDSNPTAPATHPAALMERGTPPYRPRSQRTVGHRGGGHLSWLLWYLPPLLRCCRANSCLRRWRVVSQRSPRNSPKCTFFLRAPLPLSVRRKREPIPSMGIGGWKRRGDSFACDVLYVPPYSTVRRPCTCPRHCTSSRFSIEKIGTYSVQEQGETGSINGPELVRQLMSVERAHFFIHPIIPNSSS